VANVRLARPAALTELGQATLRRLMRVWFEFERGLATVPIIRRLDLGTFTRQDYQNLLLNLRPQVIEGSRWISRCASSFDREHADIRSAILRHAHDEHRDYEMLEQDFVATAIASSRSPRTTARRRCTPSSCFAPVNRILRACSGPCGSSRGSEKRWP
jgi:hypothetical protein